METHNLFTAPSFISILADIDFLYCDEKFDLYVTNPVKDKITGSTQPMTFYPEGDPNANVFCDVEGYVGNNTPKFYDFEYLYDIEKTYLMKSKGHKNLKHNVNIFSNRINSKFNSDFSFEKGDFENILSLHDEWILPDLAYQQNDTLLIHTLYHHIELFEKMDYNVFYLEGEPAGFALYASSDEFVHLYFVYTVPTVEYLQDYFTWMFFRNLFKHNPKKPVNFGGIYGDSNIKKDKDRLCPYVIRNRWSWVDGSGV